MHNIVFIFVAIAPVNLAELSGLKVVIKYSYFMAAGMKFIG